jgi:enamine deaminase RidA (YjgF/YER057c/UK114 family)
MHESRLAALNIVLPVAPVPKFAYVPVVVHGGLAWVSGQLPWVDGGLAAVGRVGDDVTVDQAEVAARVCVLQALSVLRGALGSLDRVERIVEVMGFVASAPGFREQPRVMDAASKLLQDVFGEAGRHARTAVGVAELPRGAAVEVRMVVAVSGG